MIKEFYLAMEDKEEAKKYEPLRHTLSHYGQIRPSTIKKLEENFEKEYFELPDCIFEHSPKNIEHLQIQAKISCKSRFFKRRGGGRGGKEELRTLHSFILLKNSLKVSNSCNISWPSLF